MTTVLDDMEDGSRGSSCVHFGPSGGPAVPFGEIWRASEDVARALRVRAGRAGAVGAVLEPSPACLATIAGAWRAGLTLASLPHPHPGASDADYTGRVETLCALVGADTVVVDDSVRARLAQTRLSVVAFEDLLDGGPRTLLEEQGDLVQFTSGSTGTPKGVRLSLGALAANIEAILATVPLQTGDKECSWLPLSHDMGLIGMCLVPWAGASARFAGSIDLHLIETTAYRRSPGVWLSTMARVGCTVTAVPNFALEFGTRQLRRADSMDLRRLRVCIVGAETVRPDTLRQFSDVGEPFGLDPLALSPAYGMAEVGLAVSIVGPDEQWSSRSVSRTSLAHGDWTPATNDDDVVELVSNGPPLPGTRVQVAGGDGHVGPLCVATRSLLSEYVTADGSLPVGDILQTKDLGVVDGDVYLAGRADDLIVVAGQNLYASDLEEAASTRPTIRLGRCAAVGFREGGYALVAEASSKVARSDLNGAGLAIRSSLAQRCGAAPTAVVFVARGSLPTTSSGKLQRFAVRAGIEDGTLPIIHRCSARRALHD